MTFWKGFEAQQLVELLAVVSSCADERSAMRAAVDRAAQALEAEAAGLVRGDDVTVSVGFGRDRGAARCLAAAPAGRGVVTLPGLGDASTAAAGLGDEDGLRLVVARTAERPVSVEEISLVRGMARVLGLTLSMLRTLQAQQARERLLEHLYAIQQAISRRRPAREVVAMVVAATEDCLRGPEDSPEPTRVWLDLTADAEPPAARPGHLVAAVHEGGHAAGFLVAVREGGEGFTPREESDLRTLAEHVSLALTDARAQRAVREAMHDSLTGLASRALFLEALRGELDAGPHELSLLFIDLDRFKEVNDTLGHEAGDALLVAVAERLRSLVGGADVLARLGGDEFALLVRSASGEDALTALAQDVVSALAEPVPLAQGVVTVGASVGVAVAHPWPLDEAELLRRADQAMYEAKRAGRGRHAVFRPGTPGEQGTALGSAPGAPAAFPALRAAPSA
ncbi:hypothetical protein NUM3379_40380 [Kineococcus sp. NUM-3379]